MTDVIVKFSRVLYEPLSVTVLIAMVLALYLNRKKRDRLFWVISVSIVFMVSWRMWINIISSRYGSILIYPTIILVVYLFYRITEIFKKIPYLCLIPPKYYPWISRGLMVGMLISCIVKDLRFNHYADFIPKSGKIVQTDAVDYHFPVIFNFAGESSRMSYYTGITNKDMSFSKSNIVLPCDIEDKLKPNRFLYDVIYVVVNERPQGKITLSIDGNWELISSNFKNNRKRWKFNVYRYTTPTACKPWTEAKSAQRKSSENLVTNGDFEDVTTIKPDHKRLTLFQKNELTFFSNEFKLPTSWSIFGTPSFEKGSNAEVESSKKAISGQYSLRMHSSGNISCFVVPMNDIDNYQLEFLVRGKVQSRFAIASHQYDGQGKYAGFKVLTELKIFSGDTSLYQLRINREDFLPQSTKFRLCFLLRQGEIYLDEVSLIPVRHE
ncbi:MAG: hypothetical protein PHI56_02135 [Victivallaceae bacterium]|nr:hypothetical protein [Victivallaceae bacterium]